MPDDTKTIDSQLERILELVSEANDLISNLLEENRPPLSEVNRAHDKVDAAATAYRDLLASLPQTERERVERVHGRRVTDLKRLAAKLPQRSAGQAVPKAADASAHGGHPFILTREPPRSIQPSMRDGFPKRGAAPSYSVGGSVEAWCGPCGGMTGHTITAVENGLPKQVLCGSCGSRHAYRTEPARGKADRKEAARPTAEQMQSKKAEEARFALIKELAAAENPRPFRPGERYKAGEIIQHPEHGRGKIETVIRGAIVVRFRDGVKSLINM